MHASSGKRKAACACIFTCVGVALARSACPGAPVQRRVERVQVACELAVVHVAEGAAHGLGPETTAAAADAVRVATDAAGYGLPWYCLALEDAFAEDCTALCSAFVGEREALEEDAHAEGRRVAACGPAGLHAFGAQAGGTACCGCAAHKASADAVAAVAASVAEVAEQDGCPGPVPAGRVGACGMAGRLIGAAAAGSGGACGVCEHPDGAAVGTRGSGAACAERRERLAALLAVRLQTRCSAPQPRHAAAVFMLAGSSSADSACSMLGAPWPQLPSAT